MRQSPPFTHLRLVKDDTDQQEQERRQNAFMTDLLHWDKQWGLRKGKYNRPPEELPKGDW